MTGGSQLPPALAPWAPALAALTADLAIALGPLVRSLDALFARTASAATAAGRLDGFDGFTRRGPIDRLVASEWLLADELPLEFLRRAAEAELLYLAPAGPPPRNRGRVAVLVDTGPRQLGAGRLLQLAAIVVLHRRAAGAGAELAVGVLGDEPGRWRTGDLADLLPGWLAARAHDAPSPDAVTAWLDPLPTEDEPWLLTGPHLAAQLRGRPRVVSSVECAWDGTGATRIAVELASARVELPLPARPVAVRALRGAGFRRVSTAVAATGRLRFPMFPSANRRLVARGEGDDELVVVPVPTVVGAPAGQPRRHRFGGQVVAASLVGRRVVALVLRQDELSVSVVGKRLGHLTGLRVPLRDLDLDVADLAADVRDALRPLYYDGGVVCRLGETWWRLVPGARPYAMRDVVAVAPGEARDNPRPMRLASVRLTRDGAHVPSTQVVLGPPYSVAGTAGGGSWQFFGDPGGGAWVDVGPDEVLGMTRLGTEPALLTRSPAGLVLRLIGLHRRRTLTRWSGGVGPPVLHPTLPLLAVTRPDGRIEVGDLRADEVLLRLGGDA